MRRIALTLILGSCVLLILLYAMVPLTAWLDDGSARMPSGATDVQIAQRSLSHLRTTYHLPPNWMLLDLYDYLADHGWTRDSATEQTLRGEGMEPSTSTFAIFVRQSWFGLASEVAIVGIAPYNHPRA